MLLAGYAEGVTYVYIKCKTYYRKEGLGEQKFSFENLNPTFVPNCRNEETFFSYCTQATIKFDDLLSKLESELNTVKETLKQKIERNNQLLQDTNDLIGMLEEKEKELQKKQSEITKSYLPSQNSQNKENDEPIHTNWSFRRYFGKES